MIIASRPTLRIACVFVAVLLLQSVYTLAKPAQTILVLGDSISAAYGMSLEQGWVALLQTKLQSEQRQIEVINASISGETSAGGLRRLPALLREHQPDVVAIELGGNDGLRGYPLSLFQDNLKQMVEQSQSAGAAVLLFPMEIPPNYGSRYTEGFRDSFSRVAESTGATLAPFLLADVATSATLMQADGIHPTAAAQPIMLEAVFESFTELLDAL